MQHGLATAEGKPGKGAWGNASRWRLLPDPPLHVGCRDNGAFVSILSGEPAIEQALCLNRQLRRWHDTCPLLVFHDDQPTKRLSDAALGRLSAALGEQHVKPVSWVLAGGNITLSLTHTAPGRRLLQRIGSYHLWGTLVKVCMFLLPYSRLVFLDLDLVLLRPLDSLLALQFPADTHFAAVGVGGSCPNVVPWEPFNFGMGVMRPSPLIFRKMMLRLCLWYAQPAHQQQDLYREIFGASCTKYSGGLSVERVPGNARRLIRVCEHWITDQSLFNLHFRAKYVQLPYSYNAQPTRWKKMPPVDASSLAILHFVGDPKPWAKPPKGRAAKDAPWHAAASRLWAAACGTAADAEVTLVGLPLARGRPHDSLRLRNATRQAARHAENEHSRLQRLAAALLRAKSSSQTRTAPMERLRVAM